MKKIIYDLQKRYTITSMGETCVKCLGGARFKAVTGGPKGPDSPPVC